MCAPLIRKDTGELRIAAAPGIVRAWSQFEDMWRVATRPPPAAAPGIARFGPAGADGETPCDVALAETVSRRSRPVVGSLCRSVVGRPIRAW